MLPVKKGIKNMRGLFSYDGLFSKIADCFCLSFLWLVCSLPIVTVGASTTALYYTVNKVFLHERGGIWREYWDSFRLNFKQSTTVWLVLLVLCILLGSSSYSAYRLYADGQILLIFLICPIVLLAMIILLSIYLFPCIARFRNDTGAIIKNCIAISLMNYWWSILLLTIFIAAVFIAIFVPVGCLIVPVCYMCVINIVLERIFRKYMSPDDATEEEARNKKPILWDEGR